MADSLEDSYDFIYCDETTDIYSGGSTALGQSFTATNSQNLSKAIFKLSKTGSPTGTVVAKLYSHSGTYGTDSVPNILLATSDTLDVSTLTTTGTEITFLFSGTEQYTISSSSYYVIVIEYDGGDSTNKVIVNYDGVGTGYHDGNFSAYTTSWSGYGIDLGFEVYTTTPAAGWSNNFNGVSNANIAKINGVAIANIGKVNGV